MCIFTSNVLSCEDVLSVVPVFVNPLQVCQVALQCVVRPRCEAVNV